MWENWWESERKIERQTELKAVRKPKKENYEDEETTESTPIMCCSKRNNANYSIQIVNCSNVLWCVEPNILVNTRAYYMCHFSPSRHKNHSKKSVTPTHVD